MRVILITFSEVVNFALTKVFNPDLKYSAIVVEDTDLAKKIWRIFLIFMKKFIRFMN